VYHCPEFNRFVIDFKETYLVLRACEYLRIQRHLGTLLECGWARFKLGQGGEVRLRDSSGGATLNLNFAEVEVLSELMLSALVSIGDRFGVGEGDWSKSE
jgi:hypothetical protein